MLGTNHIKFGVASWAAVSVLAHKAGLAELADCAVATGAAIVGSLGPDIDEPGSKISRQFGILRKWPARLIPGGHRMITHRLEVAVVLPVLLAMVAPPLWAAAFGIGWLSHLAGDALTPHGIPAPFSRTGRISLGLWRSGASIETWIVWAWCLLPLALYARV